MKRCTACRAEKSLVEFSRLTRNPDGLERACKPCHRERRRRYDSGARDAINARDRRWRLANLEKAREHSRRGCKKWRAANKEKSLGYYRRWRAANLELARRLSRDAQRRYRKTEAGRMSHRVDDHRRRGVRRERRLKDLASVMAKTLRQAGGVCTYCLGRVTLWEPALHIDHVIPVSGGGRECPENWAPCCKRCNSSKRNRDPEVWIKSYLGAMAWRRLRSMVERAREAHEQAA